MVEVMLGTSARIGEVLAIRRCDVDVTAAPPTIRISGTIVTRKGEPLSRQDHPKTARSRRLVALPSFAAEAVRKRFTVMGRTDPEAPPFSAATGLPCRLTTCDGNCVTSWTWPASRASPRTRCGAAWRRRSTGRPASTSPLNSWATPTPRSRSSTTSAAARW